MPIPSEGLPTILNILTIKSCHQYILVAALYLSYEIKLIFQNCLSKSLSAASGASPFAITVLKSSSLILSLESIVFSIFNSKGTQFLAITCLYVISIKLIPEYPIFLKLSPPIPLHLVVLFIRIYDCTNLELSAFLLPLMIFCRCRKQYITR